jgi:multisubunit Na+/H+ antiporter MnhB subunit
VNNPFVRLNAALILWLAWVIAWQQVIYAAHLPGDSFTAAILILITIMLQFVVHGRREASAKLPMAFFFRSLLAGLLLLLITAGAPLAIGKNMLTPITIEVGGHQFSSTLLFELAVFLIVVGVVTTALVTFKEPD